MGLCGSSANVYVAGESKVALPHFELSRSLGEGGFGIVRATTLSKSGAAIGEVARKHPLPDMFAIKELAKASLIDKNCVDMAFRELTNLRKVQCKHITNLFFAFQSPESCWLVLDLAVGGDLAYHLKHHRHLADAGGSCAGAGPSDAGFPAARAKFYVACAVLALEHIHKLGFVHRDVKPENLMLEASGYCLLGDFGLMYRLDGDPPFGRCRERSCTPRYAAPELHAGDGAHGTAFDFFSTGVTLMELLTGAPPPWRDTKQTPLPAVPWPASVPQDARDSVMQLTMVDPASRPSTASAVMSSLSFFLDVDWDAMRAKTVPAPWIPAEGVAYIERHETQRDLMDAFGAGEEAPKLTAAQQALFDSYYFSDEER